MYSFIIVDDNPQACQSLEKKLKLIYPNAQVRTWINPRKALDELKGSFPELIFLDVEMPQMSGLDLLNSLREEGYEGKVVFTTAHDHYILKALRAQAFDYLLKPIDIDELREALNRFERIKEKKYIAFDKLLEKGLSQREIEVVKLVFQGLSSKEISDQLFISKFTVDKHRRNVLVKTGCKNSTELFKLI